MIKQLKVYTGEESFNLPRIDYDDWGNPVALELAKKKFHFLNDILISPGKIFRVTDIVENQQEIQKACNTTFDNSETAEFVNAVQGACQLADSLVEFSDISEADDLLVITHDKKKGKHILNLHILKKIMNSVLSEMDIINVMSKELSSFDYKGLSSIILSEDQSFTQKHLASLKGEIDHALKHRFLSQKTMDFVSFLGNLHDWTRKENTDILMMIDVVVLKV